MSGLTSVQTNLPKKTKNHQLAWLRYLVKRFFPSIRKYMDQNQTEWRQVTSTHHTFSNHILDASFNPYTDLLNFHKIFLEATLLSEGRQGTQVTTDVYLGGKLWLYRRPDGCNFGNLKKPKPHEMRPMSKLANLLPVYQHRDAQSP